MAAYEDFASVYDLFMDNVDYDAWSKYLIALLKERGIGDGLVLELGCGTGSMTERLAEAGYDMIGLDQSVEMLQIAQEKKMQSGHDILYLAQDMREFELYGTVRAIVSICDSINYVTETEDLLQVFRLANNYLDPGGYFIFDVNTVYKYEQIGDSTIAENRDEGSFIWENLYDEEQRLNEYVLTLFLPEAAEGQSHGNSGSMYRENAGSIYHENSGDAYFENAASLYRKHEEIHLQRAYTLEEIHSLLEEAGMEFVEAREAFTDHAPTTTTERMYIIARECGKQKQ